MATPEKRLPSEPIRPVEQVAASETALFDITTTKKFTIKRTQRIKNENRKIFGEPLLLKKGLVNNVYRDICELYNHAKGTGKFIEILGFSLRLIIGYSGKGIF